MPIRHIHTGGDRPHIVQTCHNCGSEHTISLDRGAQKTKRGPFALAVGDTLVVRIDGGAPVTATLDAGDVRDPAHTSAAELATLLRARLRGVVVGEDDGGVLIESATTGPASQVQIVDGTARAALGFSHGGVEDPCTGRPVLGVHLTPELQHPNVIALRRCNDCGANECLVRNFDQAGDEHEDTHFQQHRRAVNALAEHAKARGWIHPAHVEHHAAHAAVPPDIDHAYVRAEQPRSIAPIPDLRTRRPKQTH